jgi:pyridoxine 4-dehydrogenase
VHIVTKSGWSATSGMAGCPPTRRRRCAQVHDNLCQLGLDVLDVVNLRTLAGIDDRVEILDTLVPLFEARRTAPAGPDPAPGLKTVSLAQLAEAQQIAPVVCVQNFYNIANRADEAVLAATAKQDIAYVPDVPLGGFSPLQSDVLESVAKWLGRKPRW